MKVIYKGTTKGGVFKLVNSRSFTRDVLAMFKEKDLTITVEKAKKKRSNPQNAYYWSVVVPMVKEGLKDNGILCSLSDVHLLLRSKFLTIEHAIPSTGEIIQTIKSTTDLTTSEMMDYFALIQQWSIEALSIYIPDPNEQRTLTL